MIPILSKMRLMLTVLTLRCDYVSSSILISHRDSNTFVTQIVINP